MKPNAHYHNPVTINDVFIRIRAYIPAIKPEKEGRNWVPSIIIRPQYVLSPKRYFFVRILSDLRYIRPEGAKPNAF